MNILILNWRDIRNPCAGGAELLTHEVARRWAASGHRVRQLSERFSHASNREIIDGVDVIRGGRWWSVHLWACAYYLVFLRGWADVVIDEVHWYPFFSVLYARRRTVLLVCEVANALFFRLFPYPVAIIARFVEKVYTLLYRRVPVLAISESTKEALIAEGFSAHRITVIPMGLTLPKNVKRFAKSTVLTLIIVARLHVLKGVADAIGAFAFIHRRVPAARLWIVGSDSEGYQRELSERAHSLGLLGNVTFFGRVSEEKKFELLSRSHILLMPSWHEGWGLVVAEAAYQGTPAVGYSTAGVKDVIVDGKTGMLVPRGHPEALGLTALRLWKDKRRYRKFQEEGKKRAAAMDWRHSANAALVVVKKVYERR